MATAGPLAHAPWHALRAKLSSTVGVIAFFLATGRIKRQFNQTIANTVGDDHGRSAGTLRISDIGVALASF